MKETKDMKYRQIKTSFWEDGYTLKLSHLEKVLFLYLFTNPKVNMVGIYEMPDILICPTLGCTIDELNQIKKKFEQDEKYYFYDGWVYINNFSKHNKYSSAPNIIESFMNDFRSIPPKVMQHFLNTKNLNYIPTINDKEIVKVIVIVKEGTPYPTPYPRIQDRSELDSDLIALEVERMLND